MEQRKILVIDDYEQGILINALNDMRNELKAEDKSTDAVDDLIIKTAEAKNKRFRVAEEELYRDTGIRPEITVKGNTICGFTEDDKFDEQAFYKHIDGILKTDHFKNTSVKIKFKTSSDLVGINKV